MRFYGKESLLREFRKAERGNKNVVLKGRFAMASPIDVVLMAGAAADRGLSITAESPAISSLLESISLKVDNREKTFVILDAHNFLHRKAAVIKDVPKDPFVLAKAFALAIVAESVHTARRSFFAVAVDAPVSWRKLEYPDYKSGRKEKDPVVTEAISIALEVLPAIGIQTFSKPLMEADDVAASLAKNAILNGYKAKILSSDKDFVQLFDSEWAKDLTLIDSFKKRSWTAESFQERIGEPVPKGKVLMFMGLVGDSSDGIPGVKGIGPKKAVQIVEKFDRYDEAEKELQIPGLALSARSSAKLIKLETDLYSPKTDMAKQCPTPEPNLAISALQSIPVFGS
jgi:5'-3' exonuclease